MSSVSNSDSDRAYKSRILNFLNRQWLRFGDRAKTGFRQLQTATVWSMQLLAYPIYLLVQTSTVVGKQLQTKAVKLLSPAEEKQTASVGSQPTAVVLNSLHPWLEGTPYQLLPLPQSRRSLGEKLQFWRQQQSSPTQPNPINVPASAQRQARLKNLSFLSQSSATKVGKTYLIQGVATYLETGKLVLITTENQAIDLLSETQHEQLKQRMKILLECYEQLQQPWWWQVASQSKRKRYHPLHWLSKLMIWIQTSPLAKRLNWFQESQLGFTSGYEKISQAPPLTTPKAGFLERLDRTLSRWENTQLSPVIGKIRHWKTNLDQRDHNAILSLIRSAVDYFYGVNPKNSLTGDGSGERTVNQHPKFLRPVYPLIQQGKGIIQNSPIGSRFNRMSAPDQDPFTVQQLIQAAIDHFFGKSDAHTITSSIKTETEIASEPWLTRADLFRENESSQYLASTSTPDDENEDFSVAVSRYLTDNFSPPKTLLQAQAESQASDQSAEWLQAEAVSMGYDKHILARILEWVDRALVWLEERLLRLWQWLSSLR
jgi:hypothetical protein